MSAVHRWSLVLVLVSCLNWHSLTAGVTGDLCLHPFQSDVFDNQRMLRVWLPPGFADHTAPQLYTVLYLNDGQNLFDARTSSFSDEEWKVDETVTGLIGNGAIPPVIVVGIDHAGKKMRANEYLPWEDIYLQPPVPDPQGKLYPVFLLEEVVPFIEERYPVKKNTSGRLIGGSSYGALIALYTVLIRPGEFGMLLAESPSFYVDDGRILEMSADVTGWPERVYLGVGTHEGRSSCREEENREAVQDVRDLAEIIRHNAPDTKLKVAVEPCGMHGEEAYARRLPAALRFLLGERWTNP